LPSRSTCCFLTFFHGGFIRAGAPSPFCQPMAILFCALTAPESFLYRHPLVLALPLFPSLVCDTVLGSPLFTRNSFTRNFLPFELPRCDKRAKIVLSLSSFCRFLAPAAPLLTTLVDLFHIKSFCSVPSFFFPPYDEARSSIDVSL